ncbi:hypothetical protein FUAX_47250 (plasmid) [Fulvitalea axinellae]|uniref:Uncharacterized protein n=1 Tax=Fulvitalea axinellae TaxID=1182444 RepID=A0AAU9D8H9_9BACT|nr:hypothetical protein FUAX_47250 [Fulvitalea axinellae]
MFRRQGQSKHRRRGTAGKAGVAKMPPVQAMFTRRDFDSLLLTEEDQEEEEFTHITAEEMADIPATKQRGWLARHLFSCGAPNVEPIAYAQARADKLGLSKSRKTKIAESNPEIEGIRRRLEEYETLDRRMNPATAPPTLKNAVSRIGGFLPKRDPVPSFTTKLF